MIKLPEAKETKFVYHGGNGAFECGYESGWNAAIAEVQRLNATAQPVSDGWVKCSERMPKFGTSVLVWDEGVITGESTGSTTSFGLGIFWVSDQKEDSGSVKCYATHWMPLPAAPGGQDD